MYHFPSHVRFVESCLPGLVRIGGKTAVVPDFAPDFNPDAPPPDEPNYLDITELGDEMVGGDGDDTVGGESLREWTRSGYSRTPCNAARRAHQLH